MKTEILNEIIELEKSYGGTYVLLKLKNGGYDLESCLDTAKLYKTAISTYIKLAFIPVSIFVFLIIFMMSYSDSLVRIPIYLMALFIVGIIYCFTRELVAITKLSRIILSI